MKTTITRLGAAMAIVLATALVLQGPAGAATYTSHTIAGTLTMSKTGATTLIVDMVPATGCPTDDIDIDIDTTVTPATIEVDAFDVQTLITVGGNTYVMVLERSTSSSPSTINSTMNPHTFSSMTMSLKKTFYALASGTACTPTGTPICTMTTTKHWSGTTTSTSTSTTGSSSSPSSTLAAGGLCGVPFATYLGGSNTIGVTFHVSTV